MECIVDRVASAGFCFSWFLVSRRLAPTVNPCSNTGIDHVGGDGNGSPYAVCDGGDDSRDITAGDDIV